MRYKEQTVQDLMDALAAYQRIVQRRGQGRYVRLSKEVLEDLTDEEREALEHAESDLLREPLKLEHKH